VTRSAGELLKSTIANRKSKIAPKAFGMEARGLRSR